MGLLKKIITAIRGGAREVGETIVDSNSIRIFEQEIHDAQTHLEKAKKDLTQVMAKEMEAQRKISSLNKEIQKNEAYARQALEKNEESLAMEVAQKIADLQNEMTIQSQAQQNFSEHVNRLKKIIKSTTQSLGDMKRQLVMVKTTDSVQKATKAISDNYASSGSKLLSAKESLDRIQNRQKAYQDQVEASKQLDAELSGEDLEDKLKKAGILKGQDEAQKILEKLKGKSKD